MPSRIGLFARMLGGGAAIASLSLAALSADFINGGFENGDYTGWTKSAYLNNAPGAVPAIWPPTSINDLRTVHLLDAPAATGTPPQNSDISSILGGATASLQDRLMAGYTTPSTPPAELPKYGNDSARINLTDTLIARSGTQPLSGGGYSFIQKRASGILQQVTVGAGDVDWRDGKVHVRFAASAVLDSPASGHSAWQQPYFAVEVRNVTKGTQLFFTWNYAAQAGTVWNTTHNTVDGHDYVYSNWQAFDISPGNAYIAVGDTLELEAVASGCSLGGHEGHVYLDAVGFGVPPGLWVSASGPVSVSSANGTTITYTYTYTNNGSSSVDHVTVAPTMPQDSAGANTTFAALNAPGGTCTTPAVGSAGTASCDFGTMAPGASGTFTMTVTIPNGATGPIVNGNYTIAGTGVSSLLGPTVLTTLVAPVTLSDMAVNVAGLPTTATVGTAYTGSYTCTNSGPATATSATCDAAGLPAGVTVGPCAIDTPAPGTSWTQLATVPAGSVVTCPVSGTPTTSGTVTVTASTGATNDSNVVNNTATVAITTAGPDMSVSLAGLPATAPLGAAYSGTFTCSNVGTASPTAGTTCTVSGLPTGVAVGACTISGGGAWVAGNAVPVGQTVTCAVSGTPTVAGAATVTGTTGATGDGNAANNTATLAINVSAAPDVSISLAGLPTSAPVGVPYAGTFSCTNVGTASAAAGTTCSVSGLPPGVTVGACTISGGGAWVAGNAIPVGQTVTCSVSGTPTAAASSTITGSTGATGDVNAANNTATAVVGAAQTAVPTLSEWGMLILTAMLGVIGMAGVRRRTI